MRSALAILLGVAVIAQAEEGAAPSGGAEATTSGWCGDGSGVFADATPPTTWSPETNVVWRTPLPSTSNASPVVIAGRVL